MTQCMTLSVCMNHMACISNTHTRQIVSCMTSFLIPIFTYLSFYHHMIRAFPSLKLLTLLRNSAAAAAAAAGRRGDASSATLGGLTVSAYALIPLI